MSEPFHVCRSCLSTETNLLPMDSVVGDVMKISECIKIYLNAEVSEQDGLPFKICIRCLDELLLIRKFHLRYFESEAYLLENLEKMKDDKSTVETVEILEMAPESESPEDLKVAECIEVEVDPSEELVLKFVTDENDATNREIYVNIEIDQSDSSTEGDASNKKSRPHNCLQCHEEFPTRNELRTHFHSIHGPDNSRGFCTQCQQTFPTRGKLMSHLSTHQLPRAELQCEFCDRVFTTRHKLTSHLRTHTGERPYPCPICQKSFSQKTVMTTHMSLHTGKQVPCPKCDKKFTRSSFLKVHMRVHDDIRPYACELCDKKYRISSHLKSHLLTHTDVREFFCEVCAQGFRERNSLRSHMKVHTRPFRCPICNLRSAQPYSFRIHLAKMHNIQDDPRNYLVPQDDET